jgi:DNA-binding response OmpR family regulator
MMRTSSPYTKSNPNKARILVVDDDSDITTFFKLALVDAGFNVDVYNDPLQVISNFKPNYYDLLLIDIRMPRLNGFELLKKLRKKDTRVKVCFITSFEVYYEAMIAEHPSIKKDLDCIIKKPITTAKLLERLEMHLK